MPLQENRWYMCNDEFRVHNESKMDRKMHKNATEMPVHHAPLSPLSIGAIVGAAIVVIAIIVGLAVLYVIYKRKKRQEDFRKMEMLKKKQVGQEGADYILLQVVAEMPDVEKEQDMDEKMVDSAGDVLLNKDNPLAARFRALFMLRNSKTDRAVDWISRCFADPSALLKHELAYCLGQMQNPTAIPCLIRVLEDVNQEPMVRHEAAEALGAIGDPSVSGILNKYSKDNTPEVAETCILALNRIKWLQSKSAESTEANGIYDSVDPAPATKDKDVGELALLLIDETKPLWDRYRAMFSLRNINSDDAVKALAKGLYCEESALFRHEIAYVLGQMQSPLAIPELTDRLKNPKESPMVRHECAEALGAIATEKCQEILKEYAKDGERVVRESCEIALDMTEYVQNNEFQYAKLK